MNYLNCKGCDIKIPIGKHSVANKEKGDIRCFKCMLKWMEQRNLSHLNEKIFKEAERKFREVESKLIK